MKKGNQSPPDKGKEREVRRSVVAANWKMNKTIPEALKFTGDLRKWFQDAGAQGSDVILAPPFTALKAVSDALKGSGISLAAQDLFWEEKGAYTGQVSGAMLLDSGCKYVIIGHSERRQHFGETDEGVNRKIVRALYHNLIPIFCVGETLRQREEDATFKVVRGQVEKGLDGLSEGSAGSVIIAYEPVWAIGTGKTATPEQAEEVHGSIRAILRESYGRDVSEAVRILYGGSVTPENVRSLMKEADIDGALVGGASLRVDSFVKIITGSSKDE